MHSLEPAPDSLSNKRRRFLNPLRSSVAVYCWCREKMSVLKPQYITQGINEQSSVSEIISSVRYSFQQEEYDEAERLLVFREEKLQTEVNDLKKDFDSLKGACDILEKSYSRASLEKLQAVEELLDCKSLLKDSTQQLDRLNVTCEELRDALSSPDTRYKRVAEELSIVKLEREAKVAKLTEELAHKDKELKKVKEEKNTTLGEMAEHLVKKDEELNTVKLEREAKVAKLTEELAQKDKVLKRVKEERDEELKKAKEDQETVLGEMTEKLAKKDNEINQLRTDKNNELEGLVAKVRFLNEEIMKGVDSMHKKRPLNTLPIMFGESGDQNFPSSVFNRNACGAENDNLLLRGEYPKGETHLASAQSSSHHAAVGVTEGISQGKISPTAVVPMPPLEIIDIASDTEDESPVAKGASTSRAKAAKTVGTKTPLLKGERVVICMSGSDDSSLPQILGGKQHVGNNAANDCEMQDTEQSKKGNNWFEDFMEAELTKIQNIK